MVAAAAGHTHLKKANIHSLLPPWPVSSQSPPPPLCSLSRVCICYACSLDGTQRWKISSKGGTPTNSPGTTALCSSIGSCSLWGLHVITVLPGSPFPQLMCGERQPGEWGGVWREGKVSGLFLSPRMQWELSQTGQTKAHQGSWTFKLKGVWAHPPIDDSLQAVAMGTTFLMTQKKDTQMQQINQFLCV